MFGGTVIDFSAFLSGGFTPTDCRAIGSVKTQLSTAVVDPVSDADEACEEEPSSSLSGAMTTSSSTPSKLHSPSPIGTASHAPLLSSSHGPAPTTRPLKSSPLPTASHNTPTISSKPPGFLPTSKSARGSSGQLGFVGSPHAPSVSAVATKPLLNPFASKSAAPTPAVISYRPLERPHRFYIKLVPSCI